MSEPDGRDRPDAVPDGEPFATATSRLLPVLVRGRPAMLKVTRDPDEARGGALMAWLGGDGAAAVLDRADDALLLARAEGRGSLAAMARGGRDDEASRILAAVAARLHAPRPRPRPDLVPLATWFRPLLKEGTGHGDLVARAAETVERLLAEPLDEVVLHGDLHHGNVLDFGSDGWRAIDPKGLQGERAFDFANVLRNPDAALGPGLPDPSATVAIAPGRLARQATVLARAAGLERARLLAWTLALAGLSSVWLAHDGVQPELDERIAQLAAAELDAGRDDPSGRAGAARP